jgi:hypothetical protein
MLQIIEAFRGELELEVEEESDESSGPLIPRIKSQTNLHNITENYYLSPDSRNMHSADISVSTHSTTTSEEDDTSEKENSMGLEDAIAEVKFLTGLDHVGVKAVLDALKSESSYEVKSDETVLHGKKIFVHRSCFLKRLIALSSITASSKANLGNATNSMDKINMLISFLFDAFNPNKADDTVCLADIACGILPFCGGYEDENFDSVFYALGEVEEHNKLVATYLSDAALSNFLFQMINMCFQISSEVN